jgi:hypothetical protein
MLVTVKKLIRLFCRGVPPWAPLRYPKLKHRGGAPTEGRPYKIVNIKVECLARVYHNAARLSEPDISWEINK